MNTHQLPALLREKFNQLVERNALGQPIIRNGKPVYKISGLNAAAQGQLRQELPLLDNQADYRFDFRSKTLAAEVSLRTTDSFLALAGELLIINEETGRSGSRPLQSYPNPAHFAAGAGFTLEDLETIYNGNLSVVQDQDVFFEDFPTRLFRYVPSAQEGDPLSATLGAAPAVQTINARAASEQHYERDIVTFTPFIFVRGEGRFEARVTIPSFAGIDIQDTTANNARQNRLVMILHGLSFKGYNGKFIPELRG